MGKTVKTSLRQKRETRQKEWENLLSIDKFPLNIHSQFFSGWTFRSCFLAIVNWWDSYTYAPWCFEAIFCLFIFFPYSIFRSLFIEHQIQTHRLCADVWGETFVNGAIHEENLFGIIYKFELIFLWTMWFCAVEGPHHPNAKRNTKS